MLIKWGITFIVLVVEFATKEYQIKNTFLLKFRYSEKATKFEKIFYLKFDVKYWVASNFKWKIFSNFVAFSEYPNFTKQNWAHLSNIDFKILSGLKSKQSILGSNFGANNLKSERTSAKISCPKLSTYLKRRYKCMNNGILLPKIFWPTVRKNCSSDWENLLTCVAARPRIFKISEITRTIFSHSERSKQFLITECFSNLILEVSQI